MSFARYKFEPANLADAQTLASIMQASDKFLNPQAGDVGVLEAEEILSGYIDSILALKIVDAQTNSVMAIVTVHPDNSRNRIYADAWQLPHADLNLEILSKTVELAKSVSKESRLWIGVNTLDESYKKTMQDNGFDLLRTYWGLFAPITHINPPQLAEGFTIKTVESELDYQLWWQAHQDSFSNHFGFVPRPYDQWRKMVTDEVGLDPNGRQILIFEDRAVGFIECSDIKKDLNVGYVNGLGVIKEFHGRGLGETLLRWAFAYYAADNRSSIELNVDTGNESGALRLYEKLGMKPKQSWQQFENKDWATVEI
jgi:ribosomal protein S18 acetylase RimI-like enzyme